MKKFWNVICVLLCTIASIGVVWFLCKQELLHINTDDLVTQKISIEETNLKNAELQNGTILIGEDPQIIISDIHAYIKDICLEGIDWQEEIQVFYTEKTNSDTENFSEEKSILVTPERIGNNLVFLLEKEIADLRIDFTGETGKVYSISSIVLNPPKNLVWGMKLFIISGFLGAAIGLCLVVIISEKKNIKIYLQALKKYRYLLEDMVVRDIKLKYRRSVIGLLWSILNPLLMMIVITAVFQNLFRFTIENFAVYYLTGWLVFNFVTEATTGAMTSILNASVLIRKVYIPKYIFPLQKCVFSFVNMFFSLIALFIVMIVLQVEITWKILLIPIPLILAFIFSIGIGMILAAFTVFFRDMIHLYTVFTMVWMYLTPIIYPMDILPSAMLKIVQLNPMYYYVDYFRKLTLYNKVPGISELAILIFWSVFSLIIGIAVFKKKQDRFILFI